MYRRRPTDLDTIRFVKGYDLDIKFMKSYDIIILTLYIFISQSNLRWHSLKLTKLA